MTGVRSATAPAGAPQGSGAGLAAVLNEVAFAYGTEPALRGVDLALAPGEHAAVMGPSGCGKSTLLHVLAGVLQADAGTVRVLGEDLAALTERRRERLRLERIGMVFQFGDLIEELTLHENIALPLRLQGRSRAESETAAQEMAERLGIAEVAHRRAGEVSGGQAQRAAVARALAPRPPLVLADEPTGSLDTAAADAVMEAFTETVRELGQTVVVVTHDHRVAAHLDRLVTMRDGRVVG